MNSRPVAATFFVVFCLLLCGLILRRQIAAHPLPPEGGRQGSNGPNSWAEQSWQPASPALAQQVRGVVQSEMAALGRGDTAKAFSYGSRERQERFSEPDQFLQIMQERHPELLEHLAPEFGPVGMDQNRQNAWTAVLLRNRSGERTRDDFLLVREDGAFKIDRIQSQGLPN